MNLARIWCCNSLIVYRVALQPAGKYPTILFHSRKFSSHRRSTDFTAVASGWQKDGKAYLYIPSGRPYQRPRDHLITWDHIHRFIGVSKSSWYNKVFLQSIHSGRETGPGEFLTQCHDPVTHRLHCNCLQEFSEWKIYPAIRCENFFFAPQRPQLRPMGLVSSLVLLTLPGGGLSASP